MLTHTHDEEPVITLDGNPIMPDAAWRVRKEREAAGREKPYFFCSLCGQPNSVVRMRTAAEPFFRHYSGKRGVRGIPCPPA